MRALSPTRVVGHRSRPSDWEARTTGRVTYASDVVLPGMLHAAVVRSPHPHASIDDVDAHAARAMPGVHAVITAADLPAGTRYVHGGGAQRDRPPLADGVVRYIGQEVAAVAADTEALAHAAALAVRVRYRVLDAPVTVRDALAEGATRLHDRDDGPNLGARFTGSWGDPVAGWAEAEVEVRGTYTWPRQSQLPLEPQAVVARWDAGGERLELWPSTQAPYFVALEVAAALGIAHEAVRCHEVAVGGGFGAKSKVGEHEVLAALLARTTGRPVRLVLSRDEEFTVTKTRHPVTIDLRTGATRHGRITALGATIDMENGAYNHYGPAVLRVAIKTLGSVYEPLGVGWDARLVDTATQPGGPFRGYGAPQVVWASEQQVDELAEALDIDPIELRRRNANLPATTMRNGSKLGTARLVECLDAVHDAIDWREARRARAPFTGVGVAVGSHGSGSYAFPGANRSDAVVEIDLDGRVTVRHGGADAGTGQRTLLRDIAAEVLGCRPDDVAVRMMDPDVFDQGAWSSRGTHMSGHAVRHTAGLAAARLRAIAAGKLASGAAVELRDGAATDGDEAVPFGDLVALADDATDGVLRVHGAYVDPRMELYDPANPTPNVAATYTFAAHAAKVHVDPDTGRITVLDYVAAHDLGRALNPAQAESQIIGGVATGLGAALSEELRHDDGRLANGAFVSYAMPRAADLPRIRPIVVEGHDPDAPFDAKSVGEMSVIPVAAAIANAVHDATGVRLRDLPMTPDRVLAALRAAGIGTAPPSATRWRRSAHRWWVEAMRRAYPRGLHRMLHVHGRRFAATRSPVDVATLPLDLPTTIGAVCDDAADEEALVIGAGTDVAVQARLGLEEPVRLVSTRHVRQMREIRLDADGLRVGAAVTLQELRDAPGVPRAIAEAVDTIASLPLRHTATVGGNLLQGNRCWYLRGGFDCYKAAGATCPCYAVTGEHRFHHAVIGAHRCQSVTPSDLATALLALDATVEIANARGVVRFERVGDLYTGPGEHVLGASDVLVHVQVPPSRRVLHSTYEKLALYTGGFAVASVALAAHVDDGVWHDVRIALGAMAPVPWRAVDAERRLEGTRVTATTMRRALGRCLADHAHALPRNAWKLDLACGLAARAAERLRAG